MQSKVAYLTKNDQFTRPRTLVPIGIVVHSTGVNQRNIAPYIKGFNQPNAGKSVHGFLGLDNGVLTYTQTLPYNIRCAGCGSGNRGSYNATHIQFEICEDVGDSKWFTETYNAALDICEALCREYSIDPDHVVCHSEAHARGYASNHADVMHWWQHYGKTMDDFRAELAERLEETMTQDKFDEMMDAYIAKQNAKEQSAWSVKEGHFDRATGKGIMDGTKPQGYVTREQFAAVIGRLGLIK